MSWNMCRSSVAFVYSSCCRCLESSVLGASYHWKEQIKRCLMNMPTLNYDIGLSFYHLRIHSVVK